MPGTISSQGGRVVTVGRAAVDVRWRWIPWSRRILLAGAGLLIIAAVVGAFHHGGLLIERRLDHPRAFGVTAVSLLVAAGGLRRSSLRLWAVGLLTVTALGWLMGLYVAVQLSGLDGTRVVNRMPAPQGKPYQAIMIQPEDMSTPTETVLIQSGHGALTRRWVAACEGRYVLNTASWIGPDQLSITLQDDADPHRNGELFLIRVDPESGRPQT